MDQGVILLLKAKYRTEMTHKYINAIDCKKEFPSITILDAVIMLEQWWSTLPDITIVNCFRKVAISRKSQQNWTQDTDDPFTQLAEILDKLRVPDHKLIPNGLNSETLITTEVEEEASLHAVCILGWRITASDHQWEFWNHQWGEW